MLVDVSSAELVLVVGTSEIVVVSSTVTEVRVLVVKEEVSITRPVGRGEGTAEDAAAAMLELISVAEEVASLAREVACEVAAPRAEVADVWADSRAEAAFEEPAAMAEVAGSCTCEVIDEACATAEEVNSAACEVGVDA